jgi:hypothetical protein
VVDFQDRIPAEELTQKSAAEAALYLIVIRDSSRSGAPE